MSKKLTTDELRKTYQEAEKHERRIQLLKRLGLWSGIGLALVAMVWGLAILGTSNSGDDSGGSQLSDPITSSDWVKGNPSAKVTIVEYSDFQCPACAAYYPVVKQLTKDYGDSIALSYRHYPLPQHKNAEISARASEAAGKQGKFWEMHDLLFENQTLWAESNKPLDIFVRYAEQLKLDKAKFTTDIDTAEVKSKITQSITSGIRSNIQGTPTFYVNGKEVRANNLENTVKELLNKSK